MEIGVLYVCVWRNPWASLTCNSHLAISATVAWGKVHLASPYHCPLLAGWGGQSSKANLSIFHNHAINLVVIGFVIWDLPSTCNWLRCTVWKGWILESDFWFLDKVEDPVAVKFDLSFCIWVWALAVIFVGYLKLMEGPPYRACCSQRLKNSLLKSFGLGPMRCDPRKGNVSDLLNTESMRYKCSSMTPLHSACSNCLLWLPW